MPWLSAKRASREMNRPSRNFLTDTRASFANARGDGRPVRLRNVPLTRSSPPLNETSALRIDRAVVAAPGGFVRLDQRLRDAAEGGLPRDAVAVVVHGDEVRDHVRVELFVDLLAGHYAPHRICAVLRVLHRHELRLQF